MKKTTSQRDTSSKFNRQIFGVAVVLFVAAVGAVGVFLFARTTKELPVFPRTQFAEEELVSAFAQLATTAEALKVTREESSIIVALDLIHKAELQVFDSPSELDKVSILMKAYRELADPLVLHDKARYLKLGDKLAWEFSKALSDTLKVLEKKGAEATLKDRGKEIVRLEALGGSFLNRALKLKFIDDRGNWDASPLLATVLFKRLWRAMAGLEDSEGLSALEVRVDRDFVARFSTKAAYRERIRAVKEIGRFDPSYDVLIGEAIILWEGNKKDEALKLLEASRDTRKDDKTVEKFIRFLQTDRI